MRAASLFLVVVLAFVAIRWFRGESTEVGATVVPEAAPSGEVRFLAPPRAAPEVRTLPAAAPAESPVTEEADAWPKALLSTTSGEGGEASIGSALVHGTAAEVQGATAGLERDRALLIEAFSWAVAGERQVALSLSEKIGRKESLDGRERALFEAALLGRAATPASAMSSAVVLGMEMALMAKEAEEALAAKRHPEAARSFSSLLQAELAAPWESNRESLARWTAGLGTAQREHRWSPRGSWPSVEMQVQPGDSLIALRLRYLAAHPESRMCTGLIERSNRLRGYLQPNQTLRIPTDPVRVHVDLGARWALFFLGDEVAAAWPVGIGRPGEETPPGQYTVRNKLENPPWMKEGQEPIPFGDPRNPLGTRWIGWSLEGGKTSYGFHGTWEPESIGLAASDGCVRFLNEDVEELFQILPEGAPIRIEP